MSGVGVLIPSRNEPYLKETVEDVVAKSHGRTKIVVVLDGGDWPDGWAEFGHRIGPNLITVHVGASRGMRNAINAAAAVCNDCTYLLKCDAHVLFADGFDKALAAVCQKRMVIVPRRYRLDAENWRVLEDGRPPIDYEYIAFPDMGGKEWKERAIERADVAIDDNPTFQGSCWMMRRDYFEFLELMDPDTYGGFYHEAQEISLKAWLSGGHVRTVKSTFYAHLHKGKEMGRGYSLGPNLRQQAVDGLRPWLLGKAWHKQTRSFESLIKQFAMPGWPKDWQRQIEVNL